MPSEWEVTDKWREQSIIFLLPNVASLIQQLDQGVLENFFAEEDVAEWINMISKKLHMSWLQMVENCKEESSDDENDVHQKKLKIYICIKLKIDF